MLILFQSYLNYQTKHSDWKGLIKSVRSKSKSEWEDVHWGGQCESESKAINHSGIWWSKSGRL